MNTDKIAIVGDDVADKLEAMDDALKISDDYVHPSTRGKSGIKQSMTLAALHAAFGADMGRPRPERIYKGNNAATTLLANIGRRKVGGKK